MKRHRVHNIDFDARANILGLQIQDTWEPHIQEMWRENQQRVRLEFQFEFGVHNTHAKLENFLALGAAPFSVVAFHNAFYRQARNSFVVGAYYPALTGVCALGERVLNHLVLKLREDFSHTPEYRNVYRKNSFDNWDLAIDTLESWDALSSETVVLFRELRDLRNRTLHFNPETEHGTRDIALHALGTFHKIVDKQFAAFGERPWYIPNDTGIAFVRKSFEKTPFVARVILPSSVNVGPAHDLHPAEGGNFNVTDPTDYPNREVTDDEFIELFKAARAAKAG